MKILARAKSSVAPCYHVISHVLSAQFACMVTHTCQKTKLAIVGAQRSGRDAVCAYRMMNTSTIHCSALPGLLQKLCQSPGGKKKNNIYTL